MTVLANEIYRQLLRRVRAKKWQITYKELADEVGKKIPIHVRGPKLYQGLTEVDEACRAAKMPRLPAIIYRVAQKRPSNAALEHAYPKHASVEARIVAWEKEHEAVVSYTTKFPNAL